MEHHKHHCHHHHHHHHHHISKKCHAHSSCKSNIHSSVPIIRKRRDSRTPSPSTPLNSHHHHHHNHHNHHSRCNQSSNRTSARNQPSFDKSNFEKLNKETKRPVYYSPNDMSEKQIEVHHYHHSNFENIKQNCSIM
jgi:hypothetical protein